MYETEDFHGVKGRVPGVEPGNVSVEASENTLTIKGERKFEKDLKEENYFRMERFYGSFQRAFSLPYTVESSDIKRIFRTAY
ncbi:MAG: Hsp20/alpha crystallin family protein [Microthrixaceae bacterium]|nr:Hsp20/alpha crystallin family protein [Microthrixaceae bacterium]